MNKIKTVLYLSYDGLTDPLGQSQVLSYMEKLSATYQVLIISCEKKDRFDKFGKEIEAKCKGAGIQWYPHFYTKSPPVLSTVYDIWKMSATASKLYKKYKYNIVHCRSYIPSLIGIKLKAKYGVKFIFDMRGFWIDEKIEAGDWRSNSPVYNTVIKYFRKKENSFFEEADTIVTLTQAAKNVVVKAKPHLEDKVKVIPTCVNLEVFTPFQQEKRSAARKQLNIPEDAFVLLYSGGYGANYDINFLLTIYRHLVKGDPKTCLLILSKDGVTGLESAKDLTNVFSISLPYTQVAGFLMAGDLGVINYTNHFSVAGRSPTKLGEYWACGLPGIAPKGVGDVDYLFSFYKDSGIIYSEEDFEQCLHKVMAVDKATLRSYAEDYFALEKGVSLYNTIYTNL